MRGLEVEALVRPAGWWSVMASYTLLHTENLKDDPRYYLNALPYRPRHKVYARVTAGPRWLSGRAELLFQSQQFINRSESPVLPARSLLNVGVSSQLLEVPCVSVSLELKNLLDVQSQDLAGYPLPGRAVYLTVALAFDSPSGPSPSPSSPLSAVPLKESVASR